MDLSGSAAPPPSYDDAVRMGLEIERLRLQEEPAGEPSPSSDPRGRNRNVSRAAPPLSSIDEYKFSWLFPILMKAKDTLESIGREMESMENDEGSLGQRIQGIECKSYPAMIVLSMTGMVTNVEGDPLTHGMEPWLHSELAELLDDVLNRRCDESYTFIKATLMESLMCVRTWIQEQLTLDKEWQDDERGREPSIANIQIKRLKSSMYEVHTVISRLHDWRHNHHVELRLEDYATDFLVKMDMEYLWSYLTRIADREREVHINEVTNTEEETEEEEDAEDSTEEESIVEPTAPELEDDPPPYTSGSLGPPNRWRPPRSPPLSAVMRYQCLRLYHLLNKVKATIDKITRETLKMLHSDDLGCQIIALTRDTLAEMKATALYEVMTSNDLEMFEQHALQRQMEFNKLKREVRQHLKQLLSWIRPQQRKDEEWTSANPRVPELSVGEKRELNTTMMLMLNKTVDLYEQVLYNHLELSLKDYASDLVIKEEMEVLWGLLTRVADAELRRQTLDI